MKNIDEYLATLNRAPKYKPMVPPQRGSRIAAAVLFVAFIILALPVAVRADCKFSYTPEQWRVLNIAYRAGAVYGYGNTLAAVCEQESFVGRYIIRVNTSDGDHGSWGACHMQLTTAMHIEGEANSWRARAVIAPRLMQDDYYSTALAARYLAGHIERLGWRAGLRRYNGSWEYAQKVGDRALHFEKCGVFG
jgi:hypothetical protein